jgi:hypothetical protein
MTDTDEQIIQATRTRLAGELADITAPAGLLAAVRRRHARRQRSSPTPPARAAPL